MLKKVTDHKGISGIKNGKIRKNYKNLQLIIKAQNKKTNIQNGRISIFKSSKIFVQNGVLRKNTVKSIISIKRTGKALLVKKAKNKCCSKS